MKSVTTQGLRTPITYYGGKQQMLKHILPLIPEHRVYIEPFFGGGAVFWAKEKSKTEVVNDLNMNIVNFYDILKHNFLDLRKKIEGTMHSREQYKKALMIYDSPWLFDDFPVVRAWAFYVVTNQGFSGRIGSWGYDKDKRAVTVQNKIDMFTEELSERLRYVQIEQNEAHKVIQSRDCVDAFAYVDPPYINTNQGHYGGYVEQHFKRDLNALEKMEGKFLLSTYPSEILTEYTKRNGWYTKSVDKAISASYKKGKQAKPRKVEVLTANYPI